MLPHIAYGVFACKSERSKVSSKSERFFGSVEQSNGVRAISKRTNEDLIVVVHYLALGCLTKNILIDGDNLRIEQYTAVVHHILICVWYSV